MAMTLALVPKRERPVEPFQLSCLTCGKCREISAFEIGYLLVAQFWPKCSGKGLKLERVN